MWEVMNLKSPLSIYYIQERDFKLQIVLINKVFISIIRIECFAGGIYNVRYKIIKK